MWPVESQHPAHEGHGLVPPELELDAPLEPEPASVTTPEEVPPPLEEEEEAEPDEEEDDAEEEDPEEEDAEEEDPEVGADDEEDEEEPIPLEEVRIPLEDVLDEPVPLLAPVAEPVPPKASCPIVALASPRSPKGRSLSPPLAQDTTTPDARMTMDALTERRRLSICPPLPHTHTRGPRVIHAL